MVAFNVVFIFIKDGGKKEMEYEIGTDKMTKSIEIILTSKKPLVSK